MGRMRPKQEEIARKRERAARATTRAVGGEFPDNPTGPPPEEPKGSHVERLRPNSSPAIVRTCGSIRQVEKRMRQDQRGPSEAASESARRTAGVVPGMHLVGTFLEGGTRGPCKPMVPKEPNPTVPRTKDPIGREKKKRRRVKNKRAAARCRLVRD